MFDRGSLSLSLMGTTRQTTTKDNDNEMVSNRNGTPNRLLLRLGGPPRGVHLEEHESNARARYSNTNKSIFTPTRSVVVLKKKLQTPSPIPLKKQNKRRT